MSHYVDNADAWAVLQAAKHSADIKRPLNTFLTIRPAGIDQLPVEDRSGFWIGEREWLGQWLRDNWPRSFGFRGVTGAWSRESKAPDGMGEHHHHAFHLPVHLRAVMLGALLRRYGLPTDPATLEACQWHCPFALVKAEPGSALWSIDLRASVRPRGDVDYAKFRTTVTYLIKGIRTPAPKTQLRFLHWKKQGPIAGKRVGWSQDLSPDAIKRWDMINRQTVG